MDRSNGTYSCPSIMRKQGLYFDYELCDSFPSGGLESQAPGGLLGSNYWEPHNLHEVDMENSAQIMKTFPRFLSTWGPWQTRFLVRFIIRSWG